MSAGREKDGMIADLKQQVAAMEAQINLYKIKEQEHETMRRKLHNTIQELKVSASLSVYSQGLACLLIHQAIDSHAHRIRIDSEVYWRRGSLPLQNYCM